MIKVMINCEGGIKEEEIIGNRWKELDYVGSSHLVMTFISPNLGFTSLFSALGGKGEGVAHCPLTGRHRRVCHSLTLPYPPMP